MKDKRQRLQPNNKSKEDEENEGSEGEMDSADEMKETNESKRSIDEGNSKEDDACDQGKEIETMKDEMKSDDFAEKELENNANCPEEEDAKTPKSEMDKFESEEKLPNAVHCQIETISSDLMSINSNHAGFYDNNNNQQKQNSSTNDENMQSNLFTIPATSASTVPLPDEQSSGYKNSNNNHLVKHDFAYAENSTQSMLPFKDKPISTAEASKQNVYGYSGHLKPITKNTNSIISASEDKTVEQNTSPAHISNEQNFSFVEGNSKPSFGMTSSMIMASGVCKQSNLFSNHTGVNITDSFAYQHSRGKSYALSNELPRSNSNNAIFDTTKLPGYPTLETKQSVYRQASLHQQPHVYMPNTEVKCSRNPNNPLLSFEDKNNKNVDSDQHSHPMFNRINSYPAYDRSLLSDGYSEAKQNIMFENAFQSTNPYDSNAMNQQINVATSKYGFAEGQATVGYLPAPRGYQQTSRAHVTMKREQAGNKETFVLNQNYTPDPLKTNSHFPTSFSHVSHTLGEIGKDKSSSQNPNNDPHSALFVQPITPPTEPGPTVFTQTHTPIANKNMVSTFGMKNPANHHLTYPPSSTGSTQTSGLLNDVQKILDPNVLHL